MIFKKAKINGYFSKKRLFAMVFVFIILFGFFAPLNFSSNQNDVLSAQFVSAQSATEMADQQKLMKKQGVWDSDGSPVCVYIGDYYLPSINMKGCVAQLFWWGAQLTGFLAILGGTVLDFFMAYTLSDKSYRNNFIVHGWQVIRDVVNMFFIFILLYVAIKTIIEGFGAESKKLIINVIIIALLINFSLFLTRVIVDSSNILARVFYNNIEVADNPTSGDYRASPEAKSVSTALVNKFNPQSIWLDNKGQDFTDYEKHFFLFILVMIIICYVNIKMFTTFLSVGLFFMGRVMDIWVYMIFSPLAFITYAMPQSWQGKIKDMSFNQWFSNVINAAIMAPIFAFFLYLIILLFSGKDILGTANKTGVEYSAIQIILNLIIPFMIVIGLLDKAKELTASFAGQIGKELSGVVSKLASAAAVAIPVAGAAMAIGGKVTGGITSVIGKGMQKTKLKSFQNVGSKLEKAGKGISSAPQKIGEKWEQKKDTWYGKTLSGGAGILGKAASMGLAASDVKGLDKLGRMGGLFGEGFMKPGMAVAGAMGLKGEDAKKYGLDKWGYRNEKEREQDKKENIEKGEKKVQDKLDNEEKKTGKEREKHGKKTLEIILKTEGVKVIQEGSEIDQAYAKNWKDDYKKKKQAAGLPVSDEDAEKEYLKFKGGKDFKSKEAWKKEYVDEQKKKGIDVTDEDINKGYQKYSEKNSNDKFKENRKKWVTTTDTGHEVMKDELENAEKTKNGVLNQAATQEVNDKYMEDPAYRKGKEEKERRDTAENAFAQFNGTNGYNVLRKKTEEEELEKIADTGLKAELIKLGLSTTRPEDPDLARGWNTRVEEIKTKIKDEIKLDTNFQAGVSDTAKQHFMEDVNREDFAKYQKTDDYKTKREEIENKKIEEESEKEFQKLGLDKEILDDPKREERRLEEKEEAKKRVISRIKGDASTQNTIEEETGKNWTEDNNSSFATFNQKESEKNKNVETTLKKKIKDKIGDKPNKFDEKTFYEDKISDLENGNKIDQEVAKSFEKKLSAIARLAKSEKEELAKLEIINTKHTDTIEQCRQNEALKKVQEETGGNLEDYKIAGGNEDDWKAKIKNEVDKINPKDITPDQIEKTTTENAFEVRKKIADKNRQLKVKEKEEGGAAEAATLAREIEELQKEKDLIENLYERKTKSEEQLDSIKEKQRALKKKQSGEKD